MEYQKTINLLDNTLNQTSKFRAKNQFEINNDSRGTYNTNSQNEFETLLLQASLCDYSNTNILTYFFFKRGFENCASFTDGISKINKTQLDNAKEIDVVITIHNLIKYSDNY